MSVGELDDSRSARSYTHTLPLLPHRRQIGRDSSHCSRSDQRFAVEHTVRRAYLDLLHFARMASCSFLLMGLELLVTAGAGISSIEGDDAKLIASHLVWCVPRGVAYDAQSVT